MKAGKEGVKRVMLDAKCCSKHVRELLRGDHP